MLYVLPTEVMLSVLSYLPIPSLRSLLVLSRQWFDFFITNQSAIFHSAALLHGYIQPGTLSLEDALSVNMGRPWAGSTSWKDFCHRSFQFRKNWEGKGRAVARVLSPPGLNVHCIEVDEKAGICISMHMFGGLSPYIGPFAFCEYDNGYLVFDREDGAKEVWRLASDFAAEGEVATHAPPDKAQMDMSARAATVFHQYAPRGHFRPWALLRSPADARTYRLAYPTLICVSSERAFLYDVRPGSLVQTIDIRFRIPCYVDVNERHAFMCEPDAVHVFSRESGTEVLCIPVDVTARCSQRVEDPVLVSGDWFITPISVSPRLEVDKSRPLPDLIAVHVSRDGRDLVILSHKQHVVFIRDFERICRGETTLEQAGLVLDIPPRDTCCCLGFKHGRVCVATPQGLYIFTFGPDLSAKAVFVRPTDYLSVRFINCMHLTDRRIYFMLKDASRRQDIPLFEDAENAQELPPPIPGDFRAPLSVTAERDYVGCVDFTLMPESDAIEI